MREGKALSRRESNGSLIGEDDFGRRGVAWVGMADEVVVAGVTDVKDDCWIKLRDIDE